MKALAALTASGALALASASLADPVTLAQSDGWRTATTASGYFALEQTGTATVGPIVDQDFEQDLKELLETLNFALDVRFEAWNGRFGFITDFGYSSITDGGELGPLDISVDNGLAYIVFLAAYILSSGTYGDQGKRYAIDVSGGFRYNALELAGKADVGDNTIAEVGGTEEWVEPMIGLRGVWELNEKWAVTARAEASGFGAGGDDLQWSTYAYADYQMWENTSITVGYRLYGIDFEGDKFDYELTKHGPILGITHRF